VADLDATPAGPEFFVEWLQRALEEHSALTPQAGAERAADLPEAAGGRGFNQMYPLPSERLDRVEQAIVEDGKRLGRARSRSAFTREPSWSRSRQLGSAAAEPCHRLRSSCRIAGRGAIPELACGEPRRGAPQALASKT